MTKTAKYSEDKNLILRDLTEEDLPVLFAQQVDPEANFMAAFTVKDPTDRNAYISRWTRVLKDDTVTMKGILWQGQLAGSVLSYESEGEVEVSYWLGREFWGKGIATQALGKFINKVVVRPLHARAAKDNIASLRVLEKNGFVIVGEDKGFANARGEEVEEYILELK